MDKEFSRKSSGAWSEQGKGKCTAKAVCKKCGGKLGWFIHDDPDAVWWGQILVFLMGGYMNGSKGYRICKSCGEKDHYESDGIPKKLVMLILVAAWFLNVFLWIKVETSSLKIILMIVFYLILLICSITRVSNFFITICPFHNDPRMLDAGNISYDAVYKDREDNDFCSVSDSIRSSRDSACKNDASGCFSGGKGCPIFEKYKTLSEPELREFYVNKVNY
jgi:uncharacterized protein (DUF983 family)